MRGPEDMSLKEAAAALAGSIALAFALIAADQMGLWGHGRVPYSNGGGCDIWFYFSQIISPQAGNLLAEGSRVIAPPLYVAPPPPPKSLVPAPPPNPPPSFLFLPPPPPPLPLPLPP